MCQLSNESYEQFWAELAREFLIWHSPFTSILNDQNPPFYKWFEDGMLNASYNCIDRHVRSGNGDKVALVFESDDGKIEKVSYKTLLVKVCKFANALIRKGVQKGRQSNNLYANVNRRSGINAGVR